MILLWGLAEDPPMQSVYRALRSQGAPVFFLNQADIEEAELTIEFSNEPKGYISLYGRTMQLEEISAAYFRPYDFRMLPELAALPVDDYRLVSVAAKETALWSWAELTRKMVINKPFAAATNFSKPFQTTLIKKAGFKIPQTLITTNVQAAHDFLQQQKRIIYKSLSNVRSIVRLVEADKQPDFSAVANCPVQFQQWIEGVDYRIHVIDTDVFACKIMSRGSDYRYSQATVEAAEIPSDMTKRCVQLSKQLQLPVCGIDLRLTRNGEWYCFEVNPSPAFSYYEHFSRLPIAQAIAALLVKQTPATPIFTAR